MVPVWGALESLSCLPASALSQEHSGFLLGECLRVIHQMVEDTGTAARVYEMYLITPFAKVSQGRACAEAQIGS